MFVRQPMESQEESGKYFLLVFNSSSVSTNHIIRDQVRNLQILINTETNEKPSTGVHVL